MLEYPPILIKMSTKYSVNSSCRTSLPVIRKNHSGAREIRFVFSQAEGNKEKTSTRLDSKTPIIESETDSLFEDEIDSVCQSLTCKLMNESLLRVNDGSEIFNESFEKCLQRLFPDSSN
jgi:hypothetical protein